MENTAEKTMKKNDSQGPRQNVILIAGAVITILLSFSHNIIPPFQGRNIVGFLEFAVLDGLVTAVLFLVSWLAYRKR